MTLAFIFPGQGSQFIGMGKALSDNFGAARAVFEEVDSVLGQNLSKIMWDGPMEDLTLTSNAQPALMACSIAAMRTLEFEFGLNVNVADYVAGHSLGEYSALCAVGAIDLAVTTKLLRIRGDAMQAAVPVGKGAMAALLGASVEDAERAAAIGSKLGICQIANDNATGQIVLSGEVAAVEAAAEAARDLGVKKAVMLPVSAPFHCDMMAPAAQAMKDALQDVAVSVPVIPIVNNITARPVTDPVQLKADLVSQVTGRVRWRETILWMSEHAGITRMEEPGCGKVLSVMRRRIVKSIEGGPLDSPESLEAFAKSFNGDT